MPTIAKLHRAVNNFSRIQAIKGPILQYELRIRRLFRCPTCSRTVRTRGSVTSRECTCADPRPLMTLVDEPPVKTFDASAFVTYDTEEFTTPTEAELVDELPEREPTVQELAAAEKPLRRGKGYLRAEEAPEDEPAGTSKPSSTAEDTADFGAGIDDAATPATRSDSQASAAGADLATSGAVSQDGATAEAQSPPTDQKTDSAQQPTEARGESAGRSEDGPGRRRRRPRRRRRGDRKDTAEKSANGQSGGQQEGSTERTVVRKKLPDAADGAANSGKADGAPGKKKRRRRNRRRRGKGGAPPESGGTGGE